MPKTAHGTQGIKTVVVFILTHLGLKDQNTDCYLGWLDKQILLRLTSREVFHNALNFTFDTFFEESFLEVS